LKPIINKLISELEGDKTTIVHGDFSPKNIMVGMDEQVYILDFEVTHVGNPVFDLAFLLAHLLCKLFRTNEPLDEKMLIASAQRFISSYEEIRSISESLSLHTALIALARVEGKSPVNYLDKVQQDKLVKYTKGILSAGKEIPINQLFEEAKA
jgi:aminoglycoside phosphotransferase (APT) family kinase protein